MKELVAFKLFCIVFPCLTFISSCSSLPAQWAVNVQRDAKCGMTVDQAKESFRKEIIEEDVPRENRTHYISSGRTDVWFVFDDGKLKSVQVLWAHKMMEYASYKVVQLCK